MEKKFSVRFKVKECKNTGEVGIVPLKYENWESYIPNFTPAHDIVEHSGKQTGMFYQELHALGAMFAVRGFGLNEWWSSDGAVLCSDLVSAFRDSLFSGDSSGLLELPEVPKFYLSKFDIDEISYVFDDCLEHLDEAFNFEINEGCEETDHSDCDCCIENFLKENFEVIKNHITYGFYKAKRRWNGLNVKALSKVIDETLKNESRVLSEYSDSGLVFTLRCSVSEYEATAEVKLPYRWM